MMESTSKANHTEKASIFGLMAIFIKEDFNKAQGQVMEYLKERVDKFMKEISKMT